MENNNNQVRKLKKNNSGKPFSEFNSQDFEQIYNMVSTLSSELFKVVMACLLSIFIPQSCNGNECSFQDNFLNLSIFNTFVLVYNFVTLGCFLYLYWIEVSREQWFITHFDYNPKENEYNLHKYKESNPKLFEKMQVKNKYYMKTYNILKYLYFTNFIFSSVLVLYFYYLDYRTVTTLITNVILCWAKVMKGYGLAKKSFDEEIAVSYYNTLNLSFNMLDHEYSDGFTNLKSKPKVNNTNDFTIEITDITTNKEIQQIEQV